jgi:ssDNA-binding Zn-finger/Zn-ribbon topoisomerase 1
MSTVLICPDCGGVIGATEPSEHGKPCVCSRAEASSDTSVMGGKVAVVKYCCQCGKDLTGKKRLRDSAGYWCYDCHKADQAAHRGEGEHCADCGRLVLPAALSDYSGLRICQSCRSARNQAGKDSRKFQRVQTGAYAAYDRTKLFIWVGLVALLLLIIILGRHLGSFF